MDDDRSPFERVFRGGSVLFVGHFVGLGVSFLVAILVARTVGRFNYGSIALGATMLNFASIAVLLGTDSGVARYLPRKDDDDWRRGVFLSAVEVVGPVAVVCTFALYLGSGFVSARLFGDPSVEPVVRIFALGIPFVVAERLAVGGIQGTQLTAPKVLIQDVLRPLTRGLLVVIVLLAGYSVLGVSAAYVAAYVVAAAFGLGYLYRRTDFLSTVSGPRIRRELLAFSAPIAVSVTMSKILQSLDLFLLGFFPVTTTGDVADYQVIYPLATLTFLLLSSVGFIYSPVVSELDANEQMGEMRRVYQVVTKWISLGSIPILFGLVTFPAAIIDLTYGAQYRGGAVALPVLAIGFVSHLILGPNDNTLTAIGRTKTIMLDNVVAGVTNGLLNLVLIPRYGLLGAAVATALSYTFLNGLFGIQLYRETGIHPFTASFVRPALGGVALVTAGALAVRSSVDPSPLVAVLATAVFTVAYGVVALRLGALEQEDVDLVLTLEERHGVDLGPIKRAVKAIL